MSGQYGLALDNLVQVSFLPTYILINSHISIWQATVVTADGSIRIASPSSNPDLFFGIRGGGCNFGVVTEFVLQLHPHKPTVYAGAIVFLGTKLEEVIKVIDKYYAVSEEPKAAMIQALAVTPDKKLVSLVLFNF